MDLAPRHIGPRVAPLLTQAELEAIHLAALRVLDEVGAAAHSPTLRQLLAGRSGLTFRGERLHFAPELVQRHVGAYRAQCLARPAPPADDTITLATSCCGRCVVDLDTDAVRPAAWRDAVQAVQLAEAMRSEGVSPSVPVVPQDVPAPLHALAECLLSGRYSGNGLTFVQPCSLEALEHVYRMHQALDRPFGLPLFMVSPLRFDGPSLEAILRFQGRVQSVGVSSMPTRGATSPIQLVGGFVQALAEVLAGYVALKEIDPGLPVSFSLDSFGLDMREMTILYGSPEMNLADMVRRELSAYYGMHDAGARFIRSMAKRPGPQAAAEKAASAMAGALAGCRHFLGGGQLAVDEVFSLEQLITDRELVDYAQHVARGFDIGPDELSVEVIRETVAQTGDYLGHPDTVANFRRVLWMPRVMERSAVKAWFERGEPDMRAAARARARQKLAEATYRLPADKDAELTALFDAAWLDLLGSPRPSDIVLD